MYMMVSIHRGLFQAVQTNLAAEDAEVNKSMRTLSDIKLDELGIRQEFMYNIKQAKKELQTLNKYGSPLGRLLCLKRVVSHLSTPIKNTNKKGGFFFFIILSNSKQVWAIFFNDLIWVDVFIDYSVVVVLCLDTCMYWCQEECSA